jgi:hypothetical protein
MKLDELQAIIQAAGGGRNALAYADSLLTKINHVEGTGRYKSLVAQLSSAREAGDFRGRVLEINFAEAFVRKGIELTYGARQGMSGDIDLLWRLPPLDVFIEIKLLGQDRATKDRINQQLEEGGVSAVGVRDDTRDVARLELDILQKASTRKFNPHPQPAWINLVAIDVAELQLGAVDMADCLLAAGGNPLAAQYYDPACLRENVVGVFEPVGGRALTPSEQQWVAGVHELPTGAPHPQTYLHGVIFLFREPKERAALAYELRSEIVWNPGLVTPDAARSIATAMRDVLASELASRDSDG